MTREQKIVAIGSASGVVTMIAAVVGIYHIWPINASLTDATSRLAYTMQANAFAVIPLLLGILVIGNARFLSEAIDPTLEKEDLAMQINGRVVDNTPAAVHFVFCRHYGALRERILKSDGTHSSCNDRIYRRSHGLLDRIPH
jgi:hypothetical protein